MPRSPSARAFTNQVTAIPNDEPDHVCGDLLVRILAGLGYRCFKSDTAA